VKHLLWAITAAYFVQRHASGDEWPALMWAAIDMRDTITVFVISITCSKGEGSGRSGSGG
jgi:hypothetical protein